jgi:hypothetical protein
MKPLCNGQELEWQSHSLNCAIAPSMQARRAEHAEIEEKKKREWKSAGEATFI